MLPEGPVMVITTIRTTADLTCFITFNNVQYLSIVVFITDLAIAYIQAILSNYRINVKENSSFESLI